MTITELRRLAEALRAVFDAKARTSGVEGFRNFPRGACGDTSELIGRYFIEFWNMPALYVSGRGMGGFHCWALIDGYIVDLTADQFDQPGVIVARESAWHEQWEINEGPRPPEWDLARWSGFPTAMWNILKDDMSLYLSRT